MTDAEEAKQDAELFEERQAMGYRKEGEWRGYKQYKCNHCAFDSLQEPTIRDHTLKMHHAKMLEAAGVHKVTVPLFDSSGNQVEYIGGNEEEDDEDEN